MPRNYYNFVWILAQPFIDQAVEKFAGPDAIFLTVDVGDRPL